jgi:hypothetical protein
MRIGTLPNVSASPNTFSPTDDALSHPSNMSTYYPTHYSHTEPNISPNGYFPYHREAATTHTMMDNIAQPQNHYPTADSMPYISYDVVNPSSYPVTCEAQSSSGAPVRNPPSYHGAQYHNTVAQGGVDAWYPKSPVTGGNLPPSYPPMYAPLDHL